MTTAQGTIMNEIKENGPVHWKGFLITMAAFTFGIFMYLDSKILTKDQFNEFKEHIMIYLEDMKQEIRKKD